MSAECQECSRLLGPFQVFQVSIGRRTVSPLCRSHFDKLQRQVRRTSARGVVL